MKEKRINLAPGALTAPIPPAIVTVGDMKYANALTVAWTGILSTVPPRTYVSVRPSRHSYGILKERGEFVINLPCADMAKTVDFLGIYTGKKMDKISRCGLTLVESEKVSAPTVAECPLALECKVFDVKQMGSHDVFFADIVSVSCREEIMSEEGRLMLDRAGLLAYAHGEYFALGEKVGKFGFSTDKDSKKNIKASGSEKRSGDGKSAKANATARELGDGKSAKAGASERVFGDGKSAKASATARELDDGKGAKAGASERVFGDGKSAKANATARELGDGGNVPFYKGLPKGKPKRNSATKDRGKPHGKRIKAKGDAK